MAIQRRRSRLTEQRERKPLEIDEELLANREEADDRRGYTRTSKSILGMLSEPIERAAAQAKLSRAVYMLQADLAFLHAKRLIAPDYPGIDRGLSEAMARLMRLGGRANGEAGLPERVSELNLQRVKIKDPTPPAVRVVLAKHAKQIGVSANHLKNFAVIMRLVYDGLIPQSLYDIVVGRPWRAPTGQERSLDVAGGIYVDAGTIDKVLTVARLDPKTSGALLRCWLAILKEGGVGADPDTIASATGLSPDEVQAAIGRLRAAGVLEEERKQG